MVIAILNNVSQKIVAKFEAKEHNDAVNQFAKSLGYVDRHELLSEAPMVVYGHTAIVLQ